MSDYKTQDLESWDEQPTRPCGKLIESISHMLFRLKKPAAGRGGNLCSREVLLEVGTF